MQNFKQEKPNTAAPEAAACSWHKAQTLNSWDQLTYYVAMNLGKLAKLGLSFSYLQHGDDNNKTDILVLLGRLKQIKGSNTAALAK